MSKPRSKKLFKKRTLIILAVLFIIFINIFTSILHGLPEETTSTLASILKKMTFSTIKPSTSTTSPPITTTKSTQSTPTTTQSLTTTKSTQSTSTTIQSITTTKSTQRTSTTSKQTTKTTTTKKVLTSPVTTTTPPMNGDMINYRLAKDPRYYYEFRYELYTNNTDEEPRLMILINGNGRVCLDYWQFTVGRRILAQLRMFHFSYVAICTARKRFDVTGTVHTNPDVKWIYYSLQKWIHEIYYAKFRQYPRIYFHGISRGSQLAALLGRILPVQAHIFTLYPGHWEAMLTRSRHSMDMQTRLSLDPTFANWFYFEYCYSPQTNYTNISDICPLQSTQNYFQPVPPTYFMYGKHDGFFVPSDYTSLIKNIYEDGIQLGGILLKHNDSLKFEILPPLNVTPRSMQEYFFPWHSKPYASEFFHQHYTLPKLHKPYNRTRKTCICVNIDFRYYEEFPNITNQWTKEKQEQYKDYAKDIKDNLKAFCEDTCGDLFTSHSMLSRDLDKILQWVSQIDLRRQAYYLEDYLNRSLRIWMYDKHSIINKIEHFSSNQPNWINISKPYKMYSSEYFLQDYFQRLQLKNNSRLNYQWIDNPLLADYFLIPHDLNYYYFSAEPSDMTDVQFDDLRKKLNTMYFEPLLKTIRTRFPYWTMAKREDQYGSNHIIAMLGGRNMGFLYPHTQQLLKNVIQLVYTGIRQDLLPPYTPIPYGYRNMDIVYKHGYDIVLPQYTPLKLNNRRFLMHFNELIEKKKRLFYFAGSLEHATTIKAARALLLNLWENIDKNHRYNKTIEIERKQYETMTVINGHIKPDEYFESIQSTVFALCPEGFLPWSPRLYEALQIGAIPIILADNIVLPFERFIDWRSISAKINITSIDNIVNYVYKINNLEKYIKRKLEYALPYRNAFQWPYTGGRKHVLLPGADQYGSARNVFYYLSLELRCRRLEQFYGLTSQYLSPKSIRAQRQTCTNHRNICPCYTAERSVAFREYF